MRREEEEEEQRVRKIVLFLFKSPVIDVEAIRVATELSEYAFLEAASPREHANFRMQDTGQVRRSVMSKSLLLTEAMASEPHRAAHEAMDVLGVSGEIELFQSDSRLDSARLVLYADPIGVEFLGDYLGWLDHGGLLAVIGHEIGHAIAHSADPKFAWAFSISQRAKTTHERNYAMAAEMTADRFGLLACRDVDAVLRLEMHSAIGRGANNIKLDTASYLKQARELAEGILDGDLRIQGATHPEHYVRAYAEWLFSETDLYASITGTKNAGRPIAEVNAICTRLLQRSTQPPPAPAVSKVPVASVGTREDEASLRRAMPNATLEHQAVDILTEDARRKIAGVGRAVAGAARNAAPILGRLADAAAARVRGSSSKSNSTSINHEDDVDPLEEDRRALIARFEELERKK